MYILCIVFVNLERYYIILKKGKDKLNDIDYVECEIIFILFFMSYFWLVIVLGG